MFACGLLLACEQEPQCVENFGAQQLREHVDVVLGGERFLAELADDAVERERGWRKRACDRQALLLVPDEPNRALPLWGCDLVSAVRAFAIHQGAVVDVARIEPCPLPCTRCPLVGEQLRVDGWLELPAEVSTAIDVGDYASIGG